MVKQIYRIEFTVVDNEREALLLENNFIKSQSPKYNIELKDDKTYPYISIKNEHFPRVSFTRNKIKDGSEYFGPYTSVFYAKKVFEIITKLFPLRTCTHNLSPKNIEAKKYKVCLEYHIKNCLGGCERLQSEKSYNESIVQIRNILQGKSSVALEYLEEKINEFSENLQFELAHDYSKRAEALKNFNIKSTVANSSIKNIDVYHLLEVEQKVFVQHMKVKHGSIVSARCFEVKRKLSESKEELLCYAIENDIAEGMEMGTEIIVPFAIEIDEIKTHIPKTGDKYKILQLAFKNLIAQKQHYFNLKRKAEEKPAAQKRILQQVQADLRLKELPTHIECFDNSNIQGTNPVASMVIFRNAKPAKKEYRHYKIKTVEGANDFASMEEVVYRRYKRLIEEEKSLPHLIIVDGGKGQLSSAVKSLKKLDIYGKVTIVGIAKRLEEIFYPGDTLPLFINKKSESLKLIQQLRNEAHRFAITFHRNLRSKNAGKSELEEIEGIGTKTTETLLREFESVAKIKRATIDELTIFVGEAKAKVVYNYFQKLMK